MINYTHALFHAFVSQTTEGILVADQDGNLLLVNAPLCNITRFSETELLSRKLSTLFADAPPIALDEQAEAGDTNFIPTVINRSDGTTVPAVFSLRTTRIGDEDVTVLIFREISGHQLVDMPEPIKTRAAHLIQDSHLRAILEAADNVGFIITTVAGSNSIFTEFSPGAELIFGYRSSHLLGKSIIDIQLAADRKMFPDINAGLKDPREGHVGELILKRRSGETFPAMTKTHPLHDDEARIYGMLTIVMDLSIQKAAEKELRDQSALLRSIFRAAPVGIGLVKERIFQRVNDQVCQISGYDADELIGQNTRLVYPSEKHYQLVGEEYYRLIGSYDIGTAETQWQRKDGSLVDVLLSSTPIDPKNPGKGITFSVLDITEKNRAEKELIDLNERFRVFMDNFPGCAFIKNSDGSPLYMNKYMLENMSNESWVGKKTENIFPPELAEKIQADDLVVKNDGFKQITREFPTKNGDFRWFNTLKFLIERTDEPPLVGGISLDVTEQHKADERQAELEAQVQHAQKLESLGVLTGGIAHDFNNLLVGILGNADLALSELTPDSPAERAIRNLLTSSERAAELIRQMLAYSGKGKFETGQISLARLVRGISDLLDASISKKAILKYDFSIDTPIIEADASQVRQIIMNLITNASEALENQNGTISITTGSVDCAGEHIQPTFVSDTFRRGLCAFVEVTDTGCGMDNETIRKIFDPFFSTKFTGRGLGLAAVIGIVRRHNGAIVVKSTPGKGTRFRVIFPFAPEAVETPTTSDTDNISSQLGPATILLVDDEEIVRSVASAMLARFGVTIETADDGLEAVEMFSKNPARYDCVILDLMMPRMDGEECFAELRRIDETVTVILSSGYDTKDVSNRFIGKRVAGFIEKPYHLNDLVAVVERVLAEKMSR